MCIYLGHVQNITFGKLLGVTRNPQAISDIAFAWCGQTFTRFPCNLTHGLHVGKGPSLVKSLAHDISP